MTLQLTSASIGIRKFAKMKGVLKKGATFEPYFDDNFDSTYDRIIAKIYYKDREIKVLVSDVMYAESFTWVELN